MPQTHVSISEKGETCHVSGSGSSQLPLSSHADTVSKLLSASLPNNQAPALPAKPLPADSYKNNLLKAKHDEETRAELKNSDLNTSKEISNLIRCTILIQNKKISIFDFQAMLITKFYHRENKIK